MYSIDDMASELDKLGFPEEARRQAIETTKRLMVSVKEEQRSEVFWSLVHRFALLVSPWWRDFFKNDVCYGNVSRAWDNKNV
jgi:hypothetical protein